MFEQRGMARFIFSRSSCFCAPRWSMKQLIGKTWSPPTTPVECTNKCELQWKHRTSPCMQHWTSDCVLPASTPTSLAFHTLVLACFSAGVMMAKMMQTSSSGPWSAWLGPAHSCCSFFSPGSVAFLELEETSSSTELQLRHSSSASLRRNERQQQTLVSGWDEHAARGLIAEEIADAADGRPDWIPRDWRLKPGATIL